MSYGNNIIQFLVLFIVHYYYVNILLYIDHIILYDKFLPPPILRNNYHEKYK